MMCDDDEDRLMASTPRSRARSILRAIARAWVRVHQMAIPPPSAADVAMASRVSWYVWQSGTQYAWLATCGCLRDSGHAPTSDEAEEIAQAVAVRLRRYAVQ